MNRNGSSVYGKGNEYHSWRNTTKQKPMRWISARGRAYTPPSMHLPPATAVSFAQTPSGESSGIFTSTIPIFGQGWWRFMGYRTRSQNGSTVPNGSMRSMRASAGKTGSTRSLMGTPDKDHDKGRRSEEKLTGGYAYKIGVTSALVAQGFSLICGCKKRTKYLNYTLIGP